MANTTDDLETLKRTIIDRYWQYSSQIKRHATVAQEMYMYSNHSSHIRKRRCATTREIPDDTERYERPYHQYHQHNNHITPWTCFIWVMSHMYNELLNLRNHLSIYTAKVSINHDPPFLQTPALLTSFIALACRELRLCELFKDIRHNTCEWSLC